MVSGCSSFAMILCMAVLTASLCLWVVSLRTQDWVGTRSAAGSGALEKEFGSHHTVSLADPYPPPIRLNEDPQHVFNSMQISLSRCLKGLSYLQEDISALRIENFEADALFRLSSALSSTEKTILDVSKEIQKISRRTTKAQYEAAIPLLEQQNTEKIKIRGTTDESQKPIKVQLGAAGDSSLMGWLNLDLLGGQAERTIRGNMPAELAINIAHEQLPFPDKSVSHVYAAHVLEHLEFPNELFHVLEEIHRVLIPGGKLRIVVPNANLWMQAYTESCSLNVTDRLKTPFWRSAMETWSDWAWRDSPLLSLILTYLGASRSDTNPHKNGYDFDYMTKVLEEAGFGLIKLSSYMGSDDPVLRIDDASEPAKATFIDAHGKEKHFSLFIEARRWLGE